MKKSLQITYKLQIALGLLLTTWMTLFLLTITAADSSSDSRIFGAILGASVAILVVGGITLYIPFKAMKELDSFKENNKLFFSYLNILVVYIFFFPLAIIQTIILYKFKKQNAL